MIKTAENIPWPALQEGTSPLPKTTIGGKIYPQGLSKLLRKICQNYTKDTPLYITENGMANRDVLSTDGQIIDADRIEYIDQHLCLIYVDFNTL